ncbi:MAG: sigma-70 family RNA polymerase sigma factor [Pyrinomonadaceae bacterium]
MFGIKRFKTSEQRWQDFETEALPHTSDLFRIAMLLTRNRDEAEDLVQETLMQALKSFHRYELGTNCRAWLAAIMYNLNLKRIQKHQRMKVVDDSEEKLAETVPFEPQIPQGITDEEVIRALHDVPDGFRQVVILSDVEEFSYREIATILNVPIGTVMSRLSRGRKALRLQLARYANEYGYGKPPKTAAG